MRGYPIVLALLLGGCAASRSATSATDSPGPSSGGRGEIGRLVQQLEAARAQAGLPPRDAATAGAEVRAESAAPREAPAPAASGVNDSERCTGACRAGADICRLSEQICRLAGEIGDSESRQSCARAQGDCADAQRLCRSCS